MVCELRQGQSNGQRCLKRRVMGGLLSPSTCLSVSWAVDWSATLPHLRWASTAIIEDREHYFCHWFCLAKSVQRMVQGRNGLWVYRWYVHMNRLLDVASITGYPVKIQYSVDSVQIVERVSVHSKKGWQWTHACAYLCVFERRDQWTIRSHQKESHAGIWRKDSQWKHDNSDTRETQDQINIGCWLFI